MLDFAVFSFNFHLISPVAGLEPLAGANADYAFRFALRISGLRKSQAAWLSFESLGCIERMETMTVNPVRNALKFSAIQQAVALLFSFGILDGGGLFLIVVFALLAYWSGAAIILFRRQVSRIDALILKWGFFPICIISFFLARWIWSLRGYTA